MYPLIAYAILGTQHRYSFRRLLVLALTYVQGMALTYTLMGLVVASAGLYFQALLQDKAVLMTFSIILILLSLSMFGLFSLQLPASLQTRLNAWSQQQSNRSLSGIFLMGVLAGVICSPCTTAPLSALLLYIAQSGNRLTGALTLYLYAFGMGLPLIAFILFGHKLLPKRGPWMQIVKEGFGFLILIVPILLLSRVLTNRWHEILWSLFGVSFFCWAFIHTLSKTGGIWRLLQITFLASTLISGGPIQHELFGLKDSSSKISTPSFISINHYTQLIDQLRQTESELTLVDLYAEWCVACKQFETETLSDPKVQQALKSVQLLRIDVTKNSISDNELLKKLQVVGLPTLLFFDKNGEEIANTRIAGFIDATTFYQYLLRLQHKDAVYQLDISN